MKHNSNHRKSFVSGAQWGLTVNVIRSSWRSANQIIFCIGVILQLLNTYGVLSEARRESRLSVSTQQISQGMTRMGMGLALDIGGTKIAAALVTDDGQLSERQQIVTPRGDAAQLAAALETLVSPFRQRVDFIAVASTGIINHGRLTALNPANLGGLADFPLQECIRSVADLPCVLLNDGQAAAWAEYQALNGECDNALFVTVSTGVGGGIVWNKKLLVGQHGLAGHIGHTSSDPQGPLCGCGRRGCAEGIASGTAIGAATQEWEQPVNAAQVFEMARAGHTPAEISFNVRQRRSLPCWRICISRSIWTSPFSVAVSDWPKGICHGSNAPKERCRPSIACPLRQPVIARTAAFWVRQCGQELHCNVSIIGLISPSIQRGVLCFRDH